MSDLTKYHPFNGMKALVHVEYWSSIKDGIIPPPRFVSIDPCGVCDYACPFCNAANTMAQSSKRMDVQMIDDIINLLAEWKTRAVCVGGGGESLLNPNTSYLINKLADNKLDIGVVTNGTHIQDHIDALSRCKWVGISMDAGTRPTYMKMKGISTDKWDKVIENIKLLSTKNVEVTWKFLIHPDNYKEIYDACKEAKQSGCNLIHIRPGSHTWFSKKDDKSFEFNSNSVGIAKEQITNARKDFETDNFKIYAVEDKFSATWGIKKSFSKCYAVFVTCFIDSEGKVGLCCDRRGDDHIILGNLTNIRQMWGSAKHIDIQKNIQVNKCPRCTMTHVNEIFENVIMEDKMFYNMY